MLLRATCLLPPGGHCSCYKIYLFTKLLHYKHDVTQGQFLNKIKMVWIKTFPSPGLIT